MICRFEAECVKDEAEASKLVIYITARSGYAQGSKTNIPCGKANFNKNIQKGGFLYTMTREEMQEFIRSTLEEADDTEIEQFYWLLLEQLG